MVGDLLLGHVVHMVVVVVVVMVVLHLDLLVDVPCLCQNRASNCSISFTFYHRLRGRDMAILPWLESRGRMKTPDCRIECWLVTECHLFGENISSSRSHVIVVPTTIGMLIRT